MNIEILNLFVVKMFRPIFSNYLTRNYCKDLIVVLICTLCANFLNSSICHATILAPDDAYNFKDDEEESKPLPSSATVSEAQLREQKLEAIVAQRLARINNAHPEHKTKAGSDEPQYQQVQ